MNTVLIMLSIQSLVGAFDNLWHHEITEDLTHRPSARGELMLHTVREFLYAVIFTGIAWWRWQGLWTLLLLAIMAVEIVVTLWDFVLEDQTRRLPGFERVLHTLLAINFGAILAVWAPELRDWALAPTGFVPAHYRFWSELMTLFGLGVFAWAIYDLRAVLRLGQLPELAAESHGGGRAARTVLVTGATGFIGSALVRALRQRGDHVVALSRDLARARDKLGREVEIVEMLAAIDPRRPIDAVVNLAGEPLAGGLWTKARKQRFVDSRMKVTDDVLALIERQEMRPDVLISGSAIGYYGDRDAVPLDEGSSEGQGFMAALCMRWEREAMQAAALGVRVVPLRIGMVLDAAGGVLAPLALATRLGLGARMGGGDQTVSWIHRDDLIRLILFLLDREDMAGPVNATAPKAVSQGDFMAVLAAGLGRRIRLRVPAAGLRLGLGEMADLFLASQNVTPGRALAAGFSFRFADIDAAVADLYPRRHKQERAERAASTSLR